LALFLVIVALNVALIGKISHMYVIEQVTHRVQQRCDTPPEVVAFCSLRSLLVSLCSWRCFVLTLDSFNVLLHLQLFLGIKIWEPRPEKKA
jgi:hypothetical protein